MLDAELSPQPILFPRADGADGRMGRVAGAGPLPARGRSDGAAGGADRCGQGGRAGLAARASAALHPGRFRQAEDLLQPERFPVFQTDRGGQFTYHGPGQRVAYVMLDLTARTRDVRGFVRALEAWIIGALDAFNVEGQVREGRVGVWVERRTPGLAPREDKIAAIGVKLRRWVSFHGISLNVEPDLAHFGGIVPCGIAEHGVTSLVDLGLPVGMDDADAALKASFQRVFGRVEDAAPLA